MKIKLTEVQKKYLLIVAVAIPIFFMVNALFQSGIHFGIDFGETFQSLPNYLMLFATIITGYFVYLTLVAQQRTLSLQQDETNISAFESRFFKFIDYHRENVNTMKYRDPKTKSEKYWEGNQVFTIIYYEIKDLLEEYINNKTLTSPLCTKANMDMLKEYIKNTPLTIISEKEIKVKAIDFIYQCVFFGKGKHSFPILENTFGSEEFKYINFVKKRAKYFIDGKQHFYYTGHVRRLGHYFRNIYQAIKYVNEQNFLTEKQKYEYVTILRAQMSVYEQAVFFYNSLSELGWVWEWEKYQSNNYPNDEKEKIFSKLWVTKYDLIRNTLHNDGIISKYINIKDFYPLLNLERDIELKQSGALPFKDNRLKDKNLCRFCFNKKFIKYYNKDGLIEAEKEIRLIFKDGLPDTFKCSEEPCETKKLFQ